MTTFPVYWTDHNGVARQTNINQTDNVPDPSLPIVLLLHGMGGDINHMADPGVSPGMNFDFSFVPPLTIDRGWHGYPNVGIWGIMTSPTKPVSGLQGSIAQSGFLTLNYAQLAPNGNLAVPLEEINAVVRALFTRFNKRIVFVCHSRGGLLARLFLQSNRGDVNLLSRIAGIVTLHTPHQGSEVADFAAKVHQAVQDLRPIGPYSPPLQLVLNQVDAQVTNPAIGEMSPTGPFLTNLRASEATPLPVPIPIHTFGGTNPHLLNAWPCVFDATSAIPQWNWPPFHWTTIQAPASLINVLDGTPASLICPEERAGGDILVTDTRSHLPGELSHHTSSVNHAAALWDPTIQTQVNGILHNLVSQASFVSQSLPQTMSVGVTYPVSITIQNTGSSTWMPGGSYPFRLGTQNPQDNMVWGVNRRDVLGPVPPGSQVTFNFNITAPANVGYYHFQWRMLQENVEWFGATTPDYYIRVGQVTPVVSGLTVSPTSVASGRSVAITVTLSSPAPAGGLAVTLTSSKPSVLAPSSTITVPANSSSATTNVTAFAVASPTAVTLTAANGATASAQLTVTPPVSQYPYGSQMTAGVGGSLL